MATDTVGCQLANQPGHAILSSRGHHNVIDSPPPLGGPNEELNPLDYLLGALASCATFVCETAARELDIPLQSVATNVEGDFDPAAVKKDSEGNPRITAMRVSIKMDGPNQAQADVLMAEFKKRCPMYTTLARATDIETTTSV